MMTIFIPKRRFFPSLGDGIFYYGDTPNNLGQGHWETTPWGTGGFYFRYTNLRFGSLINPYSTTGFFGFDFWMMLNNATYWKGAICEIPSPNNFKVALNTNVNNHPCIELTYTISGSGKKYQIVCGSFSTGVWTHIAVKIDVNSNTFRAYRDGTQLGLLGIAAGLPLDLTDIRWEQLGISDRTDTGVAFYNSDFSVLERYTAGPTVEPQDAMAFLEFKEQAGTTTKISSILYGV